MLNLKQKNKILDLCIIVMMVMFGFELLFSFDSVLNWLDNVMSNIGVWGWVAIWFLQFIQVTIIPIPAYFITLTSMKMYPNNPWILIFITLSASVTGAILAYIMGRKWGKKAVMWCAGNEEEYNKWLTVLKTKKTNVFYFATVLLPIFPDDLLCLMAGSIKMNFWWFLFCNAVGRFIGGLTFVFTFKTISGSLLTLIAFGVILIGLIIYKIVLKRRLKRESCGDRR